MPVILNNVSDKIILPAGHWEAGFFYPLIETLREQVSLISSHTERFLLGLCKVFHVPNPLLKQIHFLWGFSEPRRIMLFQEKEQLPQKLLNLLNRISQKSSRRSASDSLTQRNALSSSSESDTGQEPWVRVESKERKTATPARLLSCGQLLLRMS